MDPEEFKGCLDRIIADAVQRCFVEISEQVNALFEIGVQQERGVEVVGGEVQRTDVGVAPGGIAQMAGEGAEEGAASVRDDEGSEGDQADVDEQDDNVDSSEDGQSDEGSDAGDEDDDEEPRSEAVARSNAPVHVVAAVEQWQSFALYNVRRGTYSDNNHNPSGIKTTMEMLGFRGILMTDIKEVCRRPGLLRDGSCWVAMFKAKGDTARILGNWCNHQSYVMNMHHRNVQAFGYNRDNHMHILPTTGRDTFGKCAFFWEFANSVGRLGHGVVWGPDNVQVEFQGQWRTITLEGSYSQEFSHHAVYAHSRLTLRAQRPLRRHALRHGFTGFEDDSQA